MMNRFRLLVGAAAVLIGPANFCHGASIMGTTLDGTVDAPLSDVAISVFSNEVDWQARSDDQGRFRISGLPAGRYSIEAYRDGFKKVILDDILLTTDDSRTLTLDMRICNTGCDAGCEPDPVTYRTCDAGTQGRLLVTIVSDRVPVVGAGLILMAPHGTSAISRASTHVNGYAEIVNVPPGQYVLSVSARGYQSTAVSGVRLLKRRTTVVTIDLLRNGTIRACQ